MQAGFLRGKSLDKSPSRIGIPSEDLKMKEYPSPSKNVSRTLPLTCTIPPYLSTPNDRRTECLLCVGMKDVILAVPGFPQRVTVPDRTRYKIAPIRGVGLSLVATEDIAIGDLIVAERPLIICTALTRGFASAGLSPYFWCQFVVERLERPEYEEYYALRNCKGYTRPDWVGIADSNAVTIGKLPGLDEDCVAVCKDISRANHR